MNASRDDRVATRLEATAVVLAGIAAFLTFIVPLVLLPGNIAWLSDPREIAVGLRSVTFH